MRSSVDDKAYRAWNSRLVRVYGITAEEYLAILEAQGGVCYICGKPPPDGIRLTIDHDHAENRVRGLLCNYDNRRVVGRLRDWKIAQKMADYLRDPPAMAVLGDRRTVPAKKKRRKTKRA